MKRTALLVILGLFVFAFSPRQVSAGDVPDFELIKGHIVDDDGDGYWDYLFFSIQTKRAKEDVLVKSINILVGGKKFVSPPISKIEVNKKIDEYVADLSGLKLSGNFQIEVVLDISALVDGEDVVDGGPGPNPNETIIIIEYP